MGSPNFTLIVVDRFRKRSDLRAPAHLDLWRISLYGVAPLAAGGTLAAILPPIAPAYQANIITAFSIFAAVLIAALPMVQTFIGKREPRKVAYTPAQRKTFALELARIDLARQLYTAIAWAVMLVVLCTIPLLCLQVESMPEMAKLAASALVFAIGVSIAFSFFEIAVDLYLLLNDELTNLERALLDLDPDRQSTAQPVIDQDLTS